MQSCEWWVHFPISTQWCLQPPLQSVFLMLLFGPLHLTFYLHSIQTCCLKKYNKLLSKDKKYSLISRSVKCDIYFSTYNTHKCIACQNILFTCEDWPMPDTVWRRCGGIPPWLPMCGTPSPSALHSGGQRFERWSLSEWQPGETVAQNLALSEYNHKYR